MKKPVSKTIEIFLLKTLEYLRSFCFKKSQISPPCILCYHSVAKNNWEYNIIPKEFEEQLKFLKEEKKLLPLSQIIEKKVDSNSVAITFDDGFADVFENAFPILKKYGLTATVFLIGDRELVDRDSLGNYEKLLTQEQIKTLKNNGWEIGFHSKTHKELSKLSQIALDQEIIQGKKELEEKLGFKIRYFAYPHGFISTKIISSIKKAGFQAAFTIDGGGIKRDSNPFLINRVIVSKYLGINEFKTLLSKTGLRINVFMETLLRFKDGKAIRRLSIGR